MSRAVGTAIRRARERRGLGQGELARQLGVSQPSLCQWEHGRHLPKLYMFARLAGILGWSRAEVATMLRRIRDGG